MHLARKVAKWLYYPSIVKLHVVKEGQKKERKRQEKEGRNKGKVRVRGRGREGGTHLEIVLNLQKRKH